MDWDKIVKTLTAGLASIATFVFGEPDVWFKLLLMAMAIDYISGIVAAIYEHSLSSKKGLLGFLKKLMYFFIVCVAHIIDEVTGADGVMRNLTIGFFLANEGISVLENCARCGVPFPKKLLDVLEQLKNKNNADETGKED